MWRSKDVRVEKDLGALLVRTTKKRDSLIKHLSALVASLLRRPDLPHLAYTLSQLLLRVSAEPRRGRSRARRGRRRGGKGEKGKGARKGAAERPCKIWFRSLQGQDDELCDVDVASLSLGPDAGSPLKVVKMVLAELEVCFVPPYKSVKALEEDLGWCVERLFVVERAVRALEASGSAFGKNAMASERMKDISKQLLDAVLQ
ncbi:hypothetical protein T492DRAFT_834489 [Pavlovales sp. CCMP2436]|nr:hypothetical protein T492DRAFT_834489 [Pavlovales sp. CCMP2436]